MEEQAKNQENQNTEVKQETIHPKYVKQIERLINYYKENSLHGWELTDCKISLISARSDSVISEPMHFNIATPIALYRALKESGTKLLEPYNRYDLITNERDLKAVVSMLSNQGATINNIEYGKEAIIIHGKCSALDSSKILKTLPVITSGLGKIIFEFDNYKQNTHSFTPPTYPCFSPKTPKKQEKAISGKPYFSSRQPVEKGFSSPNEGYSGLPGG